LQATSEVYGATEEETSAPISISRSGQRDLPVSLRLHRNE